MPPGHAATHETPSLRASGDTSTTGTSALRAMALVAEGSYGGLQLDFDNDNYELKFRSRRTRAVYGASRRIVMSRTPNRCCSRAASQ